MNYLWWQPAPADAIDATSFVLYTTSQRFKEHDYEVVRKDGLVFLREMAAEVKNFMDFKMSAVMVSHLFNFPNNFSFPLSTKKISFDTIKWILLSN